MEMLIACGLGIITVLGLVILTLLAWWGIEAYVRAKRQK